MHACMQDKHEPQEGIVWEKIWVARRALQPPAAKQMHAANCLVWYEMCDVGYGAWDVAYGKW